MSRIVSSGGRHWPLGAQGVIAVTGLLSTTIAARLVGPGEFGVYFLALTVTSIVAIAADLCVAPAILTRAPGYLELSLTWRLAAVGVCAMAAAATLVVGGLLSGGFDGWATWTLLALVMPLASSSMIPRAFLLLGHQLRYVALVDVLAVLAGSVAMVVAVWLRPTAYAIASSQVLIALIRLFLLEVAWKRHGGPECLVDRQPLVSSAALLRRSVKGNYQNQLASFAARNADNLIVSLLLGPAGLAQYSRAYSFLLGPIQQAQMALTPMTIRDLAAARPVGAERKELHRVALMLITLSVPGITAMGVVGPLLVRLMLGPQWASAASLMGSASALGISLVLALPARWLLLSRRDPIPLRIDAGLQYLLLGGALVGVLGWGLPGAMGLNALTVGPLTVVAVWVLVPRGFRSMLWTRLLPVAGVLVAISYLAVEAVTRLGLGPWVVIGAASALTLAVSVGGFVVSHRWVAPSEPSPAAAPGRSRRVDAGS